jgi:hypothetical protein
VAAVDSHHMWARTSLVVHGCPYFLRIQGRGNNHGLQFSLSDGFLSAASSGNVPASTAWLNIHVVTEAHAMVTTTHRRRRW